MADFRKLKTTLEWMRLGKFVLDLGVSIASLKVVQQLLSYVPHISDGWKSGIAWTVAALILLGLLMWQDRRSRVDVQGAPSTVTATTATALLAPTAQHTLDTDEFFRLGFVSGMNDEIIASTRNSAHAYNPNDHESFYLRLIAIGLPASIYDVVWAYIFQSQILALMEINRHSISLQVLKTNFYDQVAQRFPERYANYSFESWVDFLKSNILIVVHPSQMIDITVRGRDFLKYLTHWGRYHDQRTF